MSTDGKAISPPGSWLRRIAQDQTSVRILRFAVGVTLSAALAYGVEWPLSFLLPVLVSVFLALPLPMPSLRASLTNMLHTLLAFALGLVFSLFFLPYPLVFLLLLGLVLFYIYYYLNRGGSFWLSLMSMLAILLLPMLANTHGGLATGISLGFVGTSWLTVGMVWLCHLLVPDPQTAKLPPMPGFRPDYSAAAAHKALKSTAIVLPLASLFILFDLAAYLVVLIFAAIFVLKPELSEGREAGRNSLVSTVLGGVCAWVFYWLIVAVPEYPFYLVLMFLTSLVFAMNLFSARPTAKYYGSALIALLILVNGSMAEGADFVELFAMRIVFIVLAVSYIVAALKILDSFWPAPGRLRK